MITATCLLASTSPYSQSRNIDPMFFPKRAKESPDDYEQRSWRERMHSDSAGMVFIPPTAFANCIKGSAKRLGEKIRGKGNVTYTKFFEAGVMVVEPLHLGVHRDAVPFDRLFVSAKGLPGSMPGTRVYRNFPRFDAWSGEVSFIVFDENITEDVFTKTLQNAGIGVGIGRFRPENRGFYGRFEVKSVEWVAS